MIDKRRILIYNEHWIKPKRWRPRQSILKCKFVKVWIEIDPIIKEGNKAWWSLEVKQ